MILYNPTVSGSLLVTGSLTTTGTLTAQTLVVQTITSSVDFVTGSSVNGSLSSNTHQFTGSVLMSGSLSVGGALTGTTATFSGDVSVNSTNSKTGGTAWNLNIRDNTALAANVGGGISFQGVYTTGGSIGNFGAISSYKTNATSGNESGGLRLYYSANGIITQGLQISETGAATFSSTLNVANFLTLSAATTLVAPTSGKSLEMVYRLDGANDYAFIQAYDRTNSVMKSLDFNGAVTILGSGNVGIGTTGPSASLHITNTNTGTVTDALMLHNNGNSGTAGNGVRLIFKCGSFSDSEYRSYATIEGVTDGANNPSIALVFKTPNYGILFPPNERMRITGGGDVLVGTTTSGVLASANGITLNAGGMIYANSNNTHIFNRSTNSSGTIMQFRYNEATVVGTIAITSSTTSYNTSSDYRLKEDLKSINGLEKISAINVYNYKWKSSDDRMDGVLAHELQEVLPYAVTGEKDGEDMQGVDYSKLVPVLVKAIQELKAEIDTLKQQQ